MNKGRPKLKRMWQQAAALVLMVGLVLSPPAAVFADDAAVSADASQGASQGLGQGAGQGVSNGLNSDTGAGSTNVSDSDTASATQADINNAVDAATAADATANSGGNSANNNTGDGAAATGNAGIGVTQVQSDNAAVVGGTAGLSTEAHAGGLNGDLNLGNGDATQLAANGSLNSVQATNEVTGSGSENHNNVTSTMSDLTEIQNDGRIDNKVDIAAITGRNDVSGNTGLGAIDTGDASAAATLVNFLNTAVVNGDLLVQVADVFGNLTGNINIADLASIFPGFSGNNVSAGNSDTGAGSGNSNNVVASSASDTNINNQADINTTVNAIAATGNNTADANTGGAEVVTGDGRVTASNVSLANTTIEGGKWGLVIVNAVNKWLGYLFNDQGEVRALSPEETLQQVQAQNSATGAGSDNSNNILTDNSSSTDIDQQAVINNEISAVALTGENNASYNTGGAAINTGDANVQATAINIANTTVRNGSLFIAVVNVLGDWMGDLFYSGRSLTAAAPPATTSAMQTNSGTGAGSDNANNAAVNNATDININNDADIHTELNAQAITGGNRTNNNTLGAAIETGDASLTLQSAALANLIGLGGPSAAGATIVSQANEDTGADSDNTNRAAISNESSVRVNNDARVATWFGSLPRPLLADTGHNEANGNTAGSLITTGEARAALFARSLVNQILGALFDPRVALAAEFENLDTGAGSFNLNDLIISQDNLAAISNDADILNAVAGKFNTGGNEAGYNTEGGDIVTGAVCVDGQIVNDVNNGEFNVGNGSLYERNRADIYNNVDIKANTGKNESNYNTLGLKLEEKRVCRAAAKEAAKEVVAEKEVVVEEERKEEVAEAVSAEEQAEVEESVPLAPIPPGPSLPAPLPAPAPGIGGGEIPERFPAAGAATQANESAPSQPWLAIAVVSMALAGGAAVVRGARVKARPK